MTSFGFLRHRPRRLALGLAIIASSALLWAGLAYLQSPPLPSVVTAPATRGDIDETVLATGTLSAAQIVSVGAQVTGEVKQLLVKQGDEVRKGQLIAVIDAQTQENALRNAQAVLSSSEAQLSAARAQWRQSELQLKRLRELVAINAATQIALEEAEATHASHQAQIEVVQAQIAQNRILADTARISLGYTRVVAPMDGTVVAIITEQGQTVNAALAAPVIVKLANLNTMTAKVQISEADVTRVRAGMPVTFNLIGDQNTQTQATLRNVEPGPTSLATEPATPTQTPTASNAVYYNGIFDVSNPDRRLRINMTVQASITLRSTKNALLIPAAALDEKPINGRYKVKVLEGQQLRTREVRIGMNNRIMAQVLEGLAPGERVVTSEALATTPSP